MLAGAHALHALVRMHSGGRGQDHGLDAWLFQALAEIAGPMRDFETLGHFRSRGLVSTGQRDDLDARDIGKGLQMLHAECTLSSDTDLHVGFLTSKSWRTRQAQRQRAFRPRPPAFFDLGVSASCELWSGSSY